MDEFNAWINDMELMDVDIANSKFTWSNKRRDPTLVKLDRVLINIGWSKKIIHSECRALVRQTSDHKPILLDTACTTVMTRSFRYEDYWLQTGDLVTITKERLARNTRDMAIATKLNHGLRMIRAATRAWLKDKVSQKTIRLNIIHTIQYFDAIEEWRNLTDYEFAFRIVCSEELHRINSVESNHWKRRAKIKWCKLGDENTNFFHNMATYRYRKNKMKVLCLDQQEFFDDPSKLAIATNYFSNLFREDRVWVANIDLNLLYNSNSIGLGSLDSPFCWQEIEHIKQTPPSRSPGPDGFTNEFFKFYMNEMKVELLQLFSALYSKNISLAGLNLANIALLPKLDNALELNNYRPISLQHSLPKLIAKVLSNKLQPKMKQLIDEMQSGFIKNRSIVENFATAIKMVQCGNRLKRPIIILKLDF
jgi:hypothetical protein